MADDHWDRQLFNPSYTNYFGQTTPRNAGDYNGDGYNDLVQYDYYSKTIYLYFGGTDFDQFYDHTIHDTLFSIMAIDFVDGFGGSPASDILINQHTNGIYNYWGYSWFSILNQGPDYILNSQYYRSGVSVASGDFNLDGIAEIFAGSHLDRNHGMPGGQINFYDTLQMAVNTQNGILQLQSVKLFPNPVASYMVVSFCSYEKEPVNIRIIDMNGKIQFAENYNDLAKGNNNLKIKTESLKPGVYILLLQQKSSLERVKFIVVK